MIRFFLIGMAMGVCDLIPGVSGGTVAYISGIYTDFLDSIKSLSFQSLRTIRWRFLLPLGFGIAASVLLFSRTVYFLMQHYQWALFSLFFGLILASALQSMRSFSWRHSRCWLSCSLGFGAAYLLSGLSVDGTAHIPHFWLFFCGALGAAAMLLPGISGSFILQVLGVYPLFIKALATITLWESLTFIVVIGLGVATGFILFSRLVSYLIARYPQVMKFALSGLMLGGLRALWPFSSGHIFSALLLCVLGFVFTVILENWTRKLAQP
ncbi:MAG: DUF368 domain-containing protein [Chlamydiales bacterium]